MSFSKVNPSGFSTGATLTAAQMNQLDADHANSLDKSLAGDTLSGVVTLASTAEIVLPNSGGVVLAQANGSIVASAAKAVKATAAGAVAPTVAGGISDGGTASGIEATTTGGIVSTATGGIGAGVAKGIRPGLSHGINSDAASGISSDVVGGIATKTSGGLALTGGSSDWPTFGVNGASPRTRNHGRVPRALNALTAGWGAYATFPGLSAPGNGTSQIIELSPLHDGATLTGVQIGFVVSVSHNGGGSIAGMTMPSVQVLFYPANFPASPQYLSSTNIQFVSNPGTGNAWYNGGAAQFFTYSCNQNNVVAAANGTYVAIITDETGSGALSGNVYHWIAPQYGSITDMRFP